MAVYGFKPWLVAPVVLGVIISAIYGLRAIARIFFGDESEDFIEAQKEINVTDMNWAERVPALLLIIALFFIGFVPRSITTSINDALEQEPSYQQSATVDVAEANSH